MTVPAFFFGHDDMTFEFGGYWDVFLGSLVQFVNNNLAQNGVFWLAIDKSIVASVRRTSAGFAMQ